VPTLAREVVRHNAAGARRLNLKVGTDGGFPPQFYD
jgi:hypothetical protein